MSKGEGAGQPQLYCTSCGAQVRLGHSFCTSCGVVLDADKVSGGSGDNPVSDYALGEKRSDDRRSERISRSPHGVYSEYELLSSFFHESREGLVRFSERLKNQAERADHETPLIHNDLARPLLYAQRGLNKADEYRETLTTLYRTKSSWQEAQSRLADLRQVQRDVLVSLESFYDKLEATGGYEEFEGEFGRWYMDMLEPYIGRAAFQQDDSDEQDSSHEPTQVAAGSSADGFDVQEIASKLVGWFKNLPTAAKVILVGLILLALLAILSPLAFIVAVLLFGVSIVALIVRVVQRRTLGGWAAAAGISLALVLGLGSISGVLYGNIGPMGKTEGSEVREEESRTYERDTGPIVDYCRDTLVNCPSYWGTVREGAIEGEDGELYTWIAVDVMDFRELRSSSAPQASREEIADEVAHKEYAHKDLVIVVYVDDSTSFDDIAKGNPQDYAEEVDFRYNNPDAEPHFESFRKQGY